MKSFASKSPHQKRRPFGLDLKNPPRPLLSNGLELDKFTDACDICSKSPAPNTYLCEDCQIWNDIRHVFNCLRDVAEWEKHVEKTLETLLGRTECMMCQTVAHTILQRFAASDEAEKESLNQVEVKYFGPFCEDRSILGVIDPDYKKQTGELILDENHDYSLLTPDALVQNNGSGGMVVPLVLYVVVTAPLGFSSHASIPELDRKVRCTDTQETKVILGPHRKTPSGGSGLLQPTIGVQIKLQYEKAFTQLSKIERWEDSYIDVALVSNWMSTCETQHKARCWVELDDSILPPGFKAIDTQSLCIVDLAHYSVPRYVALSYTWGSTAGAKELQLERSNVTSLSQPGALAAADGIPELIMDAIRLAGDIGEQYIWVDRLCIIQDDPASKYLQIQAMDKIYSLARFTIIAAVPPGIGLPGVSNRPRKSSLWNQTRRFSRNMRDIGESFFDTALGSFWNTRGWTYQERQLSRRAVYITEFEVYFLCKKRAEQGSIGEIAAAVDVWDYDKLSLYRSAVVNFTARNLSFPSDILNAFTGVGNQFAKAQDAPLRYGLPEKYFLPALLWEPALAEYVNREVGRRIEALDIPTWSWAAWKGTMMYDLNTRVSKGAFGTLVRFHFQDATYGLRSIMSEETWFFKNVRLEVLKDLPSINVDNPEMRFMPSGEASTRSWHQCPHNPWEVTKRTLSENMQSSHTAPPGSLVFITTLAKLGLRYKPPPVDQTYRTAVELEILDPNGGAVGEMRISDPAWTKENANPKEKHDIIVLAAGILNEHFRYAETHSITLVSGEIRSPDRDKCPWYLHVMLIKRNSETGVAQRLGIGTVEMQAWRRCEPQWSTIVLA